MEQVYPVNSYIKVSTRWHMSLTQYMLYKSLCLPFRLSSAKPSASVIMDGKRLSEDEEDEDEQFVVEEAVPPPSDAPEMEVVSDLNRELFEYHWKTKALDNLLFLLLQGPAQELDSGDKHGT